MGRPAEGSLASITSRKPNAKMDVDASKAQKETTNGSLLCSDHYSPWHGGFAVVPLKNQPGRMMVILATDE
jgi:hypothetical protein